VVSPRIAVVAAVGAASVGIQSPLERHALDSIQRRPALNFLVARCVGATLCLGERSCPACFHQARDLPGCGDIPADLEEQRLPH